jgi:hypothetical protein
MARKQATNKTTKKSSGGKAAKKHSKTKDDETMNYGEVADSFADDMDPENDQDYGDDDNEDEESENDESGSSSDDSDDDEEEVDVAAALFQGGMAAEQDDNEESDDESTSDDEEDRSGGKGQKVSIAPGVSQTSAPSEPYTFDLRNLLAVNTDPISTNSLYIGSNKAGAKKGQEALISIPLDQSRISLQVDEAFLLSKATAGCTQLIQALWQLPTEQSAAGPLVTLPSYDEVRLPRSLVSSTPYIIPLSICFDAWR